MDAIFSTRFSSCWSQLDPNDQAILRATTMGNATSDEQVLAQLIDPERIETRVRALTEDDRDLLFEICFESRIFFESGDDDEAARLHQIFAQGLVVPFVLEDARVWLAPLEIRATLVNTDALSDADLAVVLTTQDDELLADLAASHALVFDDDTPELERVEAITQAILDDEQLHQLITSLTPEALTLLLWFVQRDGPVAVPVMHHWIEDHQSIEPELYGSVVWVLHRFGLIYPYTLHELEMWMMPSDLRYALMPILTYGFDQSAGASWETLRDNAQSSFRDEFPRGSAGSPLVHARYRLMRCIAHGPDDASLMDRLLQIFFIYNPDQQGPGALASYQLDVHSPDAFARHMLRVWIGSLDDSFTRMLIEAFGGDGATIEAWLRSDADRSSEPSEESLERQLWLEILVQMRGMLTVAMSCLSAGLWYRLDDLVNVVLAIYRRATWQYGRYRLFEQNFPFEALPVGTEDIRDEHRAALTLVLRKIFRQFFEVIGAAQMNATDELFLVNSEAFRIFRETDPHFDGIWECADALLNDDIDLWLPLPGDPGVCYDGLPSLYWDQDEHLRIPLTVPVADLVRIAEWGTPRWEGAHFSIVFDIERLSTDTQVQALEEWMLWLVIRAHGPIPDTVRSLIPLSSARADGSEQQVVEEAKLLIRPMVDALESWGEGPPLALMEELRSWGDALVAHTTERVNALLDAQQYDAPLLRHFSLLLAELQAQHAGKDIFRAFMHCRDDVQEGALGAALSRLGVSVLAPLVGALRSTDISFEKRLAVAGVLAGIGVLHPQTRESVFRQLSVLAGDPEIGDDVSTILAVYAADLGHPESEELIQVIQSQGRWMDEILPFEDALWTAAISPCNWGHPIFSNPLAQIFPNVWESEAVLKASGMDDVLARANLERTTVLGRIGGWRRRT